MATQAEAESILATLGKLKVKELKEHLSGYSLSTSGKKSELAARLTEYLESVAASPATDAPKEDKEEGKAATNDADTAATAKRKRSPEPAESASKKVVTAKVTEPLAATPTEKLPVATPVEDRSKRKRSPSPTTALVEKKVKELAKSSEAPTALSSKVEPTPVDSDEDDDEIDYKDNMEDFSRNCPYLDTINRMVLDFDFEKLCSVSMSNVNVYACLVCGKYFKGRGKDTHAYTHSLQIGHHVFLNLHTLKFYCLPDNYEVIDRSLEDITYVLRPKFRDSQIQTLDTLNKPARALDGTTYLPGIMGLNNIKANDYVNSVVQVLLRVRPLRDYFLKEENFVKLKDPLVVSFAELIRKLSNPRAFKSHVSPHEFLQAVTNASERKFKITEQKDPIEFLSWLLNTLHMKMKKKKKSIIYDTFRGLMNVTSRKVPPVDAEKSIDPEAPEYKEVTKESPFLYLALDIPPAPLFREEQSLIPQIPLFELLNKYDSVTEKEYKTYKDIFMKKFRLSHMPNYLILHITRFTKNNFFVEKNPTIVNFPVKDIDWKDYVFDKDGEPVTCGEEDYKYDLVGHIVHDGLPKAGEGSYRSSVYHKGVEKWFDMQDLHVTEILPQMITLSESYIQIWERRKIVA